MRPCWHAFCATLSEHANGMRCLGLPPTIRPHFAFPHSRSPALPLTAARLRYRAGFCALGVGASRQGDGPRVQDCRNADCALRKRRTAGTRVERARAHLSMHGTGMRYARPSLGMPTACCGENAKPLHTGCSPSGWLAMVEPNRLACQWHDCPGMPTACSIIAQGRRAVRRSPGACVIQLGASFAAPAVAT